MRSNRTYAKHEATTWPIPNYWDIIALALVIGVILLFGLGAKAMTGRYHPGQAIPISLDPRHLPLYALYTVLRMLLALGCSLLFTFIFGTLAAKNRHAERIIIPMIDILQSVPVLGFLSLTITSFIGLFAGNLLGPECAAIFAIFTAQVWNMTLSFYQSVSTIPTELKEAAAMFHLSWWQRFWRIEVPFAMPGLIWNAMLSMSGSWIFLVAAESIAVGTYTITLPGIGSYTALAIAQMNKMAIGYVIITMFLVIALYDQLLFRPLVAWAEKFKAEITGSETLPQSWVLDLFQRTRLFNYLGHLMAVGADRLLNYRRLNHQQQTHYLSAKTHSVINTSLIGLWYTALTLIVLLIAFELWHFVLVGVSYQEILHVIFLGLVTTIRVMSIIALSSLIWVPIGVRIGLNPKLSLLVQPIAQFLAAFPANLLFPLVVSAIITYQLNVNIWTSPLMILGTQWYILFNVIAGASALPKNMCQAVSTLNVKGRLWWQRFALPGIFPYYITGAISAAGGAWNISIIAESVQWGHTHLQATGIGAYIATVANAGDFPRLVLGILVMSWYVLLINRLIWRPLYRLAEERFQK